jgi:hypothetical protein
MQQLPSKTKNFVPAEDTAIERFVDRFDYAVIGDERVAVMVRKDAAKIVRARRRLLRDLLAIGEMLLVNRERFRMAPRGAFGEWRDSLGVSERMAQNLMRVANDDDIAGAIRSGDLAITESALYKLSAGNVPASAVSNVLDIARNGDGTGAGGRVTRRDVDREVRRVRPRVERDEDAEYLPIEPKPAGERAERDTSFETIAQRLSEIAGILSGDLASDVDRAVGREHATAGVANMLYMLANEVRDNGRQRESDSADHRRAIEESAHAERALA